MYSRTSMGHSSSSLSSTPEVDTGTLSSYHTTSNTPYGRHRFTTLPFGLNCAQDVFLRKVDETFSDIPGATRISDDIIVVGYKSDGSDHDANLTATLERTRSTGLCSNDKKIVVRCKRIPFFRNIIGADGIKPDTEQVTAICNMSAPTDVKEFQTFVALANYPGRFTLHLATAPLRYWCKTNAPYGARRTLRGLDLSVHEVHMHLNASPTRIMEIRMETSKDSILNALCEMISLGWPENRAHCPARLMPFWNFRDELSV